MTAEPVRRVDLRLVPAAVGAWAVTAAGILWPIGAALAVACAVLAAAWPLVCGMWGERHPGLRAARAGVVGAAVVGAGFGLAVGLRSDAVRSHPVTLRFGTTSWVTVVPGENPRSLSNGRLMFRGALIRLDDAESTGLVTVFASAPAYGRLSAGRPARFRARIGRPTRQDLTVAVLTAAGEPVAGAGGPAQRWGQEVRGRLAGAAREALPAEQAAVLPGLVLGDTSAVTTATTAAFRTAGLTHLTAVSGANVTIVCGTMLLSARLIGPRAAVVLAAVALLAFVVVVQPTASVLRAAVMGAISLLAVVSARRRQAIPALSATVLVLMVTAPQLAVDPGFILSVSATAALVLLAPLWSARWAARGVPKPLADAFAVAVAAQVVTAPVIAAISGRFSTVAVMANVLVAPVIPVVTVLGTAAAALCPVWPAGAELLIRFTGPALWWLLQVARTGAGVPMAALPVPDGAAGAVVVAGAAVLAVVGRRSRWFRVTAAAAAVAVIPWWVSAAVGWP